VLGGEEVLRFRLREDLVEERLGDVPGEQAVPVLGEDGGVPHGVIHPEPHEPAEEEVVVELLHELPLAPDREEDLEQERAEELLRRDRRATGMGVQQGEARRQLLQGRVHHHPDRAERMVLRDPPLGGGVTPHAALLGIVASHRAPPLWGPLLQAHCSGSEVAVDDEITSFSASC
jgi:hypothetical protein